MICITKFALGEARHLVQHTPGGKFQWVDEVPGTAWTYGDPSSITCLEELAHGLSASLPMWPPKVYKEHLSQLNLEESQARWALMMPKRILRQELGLLLEELWKVIQLGQEYIPAFKISQEMLCSCWQAKVDPNLWRDAFAEAEDGQRDVVGSFRGSEGVLPKVIYSRQTSTGRTTVVEGPQILRLAKRHRTFLCSRYGGGRIIQVDYSAVEPRTLLSLMGGLLNQPDIYNLVSEDILRGVITRAEAKIVVMGILYGIGLSRLKQLLGDRSDIEHIVSHIRRMFKLSELEERLKMECDETARIRTAYGRILTPSRTDAAGLVSYYVQGTAVDGVLSGFSTVVKSLQARNLKVHPIFLVHDALFLDVHPEVSDVELEEMVKVGETIQGLPGRFPLEMKPLLGV